MAVASVLVDGKVVAVRNFYVPKRASELKYWYKAVQQTLPSFLPPFHSRYLEKADVTVETIHLEWDNYQLIIARKARL